MLRVGVAGVESVADLAESRGVREPLQWFTRERQWINDQHLQLSRIAAPTFFEQKRAEWVAAQFRELGCEVKTDRAGNVVAQLAPDRDGPFVALTAHLDTVLGPRSPEDISVHPDGTFRGPGISDNGAGLAALLAIAAALKASPAFEAANASILFVANVGEEGEGNLSGMRYLCRQSPLASKIRSYLVLDGPATDHITCQALASRRFEVIFSGPGGHSWSDYGIGNPVHAVSRAITLFSEAHSLGANGETPKCSFNFGTIEGGVSINSIPASARTKLDIRSESARKLEELSAVLTESVEQAMERENQRATGAKITAKIREVGSRPGGKLPEDASVLAWLRAVDAHLAIRSHIDCASTDANIPLSLGIPAVSIGAGGHGGGAHTASEWFHPEGRDIGLKRIFLTLCLLLAE